ncbi:terminase [Longimycelium tulufanense]|uniref:Terminase n=1 Tax=Longimycelium tulufanense TaxID=907463 RepID=A0A8J3FTD1_9PSEU|nr:terminase large subunit [Longimycelium tulufanense]GGM48521.1 terminase [Longimycelium tulufanense]
MAFDVVSYRAALRAEFPEIDYPTEGWKVIEFIERFCRLVHTHAGQPFLLRRWQKLLLLEAYRLSEDGRRKHTLCVVNVARKQGKSTLGAALMLYHLMFPGADRQPQIVSAANDRNQARMVFDTARQMVQQSPELSKRLIVRRNEIQYPRNLGVYRVISADADRAVGLNVSAGTIDEYGFAKTSDLYAAITTSAGTRKAPMVWVLSTASNRADGPFAVLCERGRRANAGEEPDPTLFYRSWAPEPGETVDHTDPAVWHRCNPMLVEGLISEDYLRAQLRQQSEAEFRMYFLSEFVHSGTSWLPFGAWETIEDRSKPLRPGDEIVVGFDGAHRGDSTAIVGVRLDDLHASVLGHWEAPIEDRHWRTPREEVKTRLREISQAYRVKEIIADPYYFEETLETLAGEGLPIVEFPTNSLARICPATQTAYDLVMDQRCSHDGDPALARHVANAVVREDRHGQRITKEHKSSKRRIDLAVAWVIAVHHAKAWREEPHTDFDGIYQALAG